ncbi:TetR/AcrR family transcriptional regulator [Bacillus sp. FJAT-22090]|uniref:TetR/AcrR family transcriptional regulator n=1 Tax=Bacillus sp. FJAT-22090 TaxID=1581038 RepID=UPI0021B4A708|nr:TetR family transcriptional regulator [Bacillus sp. FJAT-22090]
MKDQILKSAKFLFSRKGFDGTTVRQICDEAGVSLALISYHFGGKENVFNALFEPLRHTFMNAHYDLSDSLNSLKSFCRNFVLYRTEEYELIDILQQELVMNSPRLEMLKDVFLPSWEQLRSILLACKEQKTIDFDSIDVSVNFVMGTLMYSFNNPFLNRSSLDLTTDQVANLAVSYILNGLRAKNE